MAVASGTRRGLTLAVLVVGGLSFGLLQSMVNPVLPTLQRELDTSTAGVTWVITAYLLSAAVCTPILGRLGDMLGKKKLLVAVLITLSLGCLLAALSTSLWVMVLARVVQGAGGGLLPLSFGIIRDEMRPHTVPRAIAGLSSVGAAGGAMGLVVAGPITDALDYTWLFWLPMGVVSCAALAAHLFVPASPQRAQGRINWRAAALLSGWLVALLLAVGQASAWGWFSPRVLGLFAAAGVLGIGWVLVESRAVHPLISLTMMRIRAVWTTNLVALLFGFAMWAGFAFVPQFVQVPGSTGYGFGMTITGSGLMVLPQAIAAFLLGLSAGRLTQWISAKGLLMIGAGLSASGFFLLASFHSQPWMVYPFTTLMGSGYGLAFAALAILIVAAVSPSQTGVASGMNANIRTIGGAIGAAVMAGVVSAGAGSSSYPLESGYTTGFVMVGSMCLLGGVAALLIPTPARPPRSPLRPEVPARVLAP